jgi:hypothetical protein
VPNPGCLFIGHGPKTFPVTWLTGNQIVNFLIKNSPDQVDYLQPVLSSLYDNTADPSVSTSIPQPPSLLPPLPFFSFWLSFEGGIWLGCLMLSSSVLSRPCAMTLLWASWSSALFQKLFSSFRLYQKKFPLFFCLPERSTNPRVNHQYTTYTFVFTHPMVHVRIDVPAEQLRKLVASLRPSDFPIVIRVPLNLPNIPHIHMPDMTYVYISSTTFNIVHNALNRGRNEGYIFSLVVCVECDEWPCHAMTTPHL